MNITDLVSRTTNNKSEAADSTALSARTATSETSSTGEEFSTFLTLLTAQIRNQDPLAPLDSTQFVEQLATFSSLELQAKGNDILEDIAIMLAQELYSPDSSAPIETET